MNASQPHFQQYRKSYEEKNEELNSAYSIS